jgi:hypothetical protein
MGLGGGTGGRCLRIGTVNVGTLKGRDGEVVDLAERRRLDFCCLQETRWKGENARELGPYKLFWVGGKESVAGVGVLVAKKWVESVLEVKRVSERLLVLRVIVGKSILNLISAYAPQVGRTMEEKEEFFASLGETVSAVGDKEGLVLCGDMNGHVGALADGFEGVHGGFGFGNRNVEGEMLLEFAEAKGLVVTNTWFKKDVGKLVTYESGERRTMIDYVLVRKDERRFVQDVKVIRSEECIPQHKLLVCLLKMRRPVRRKEPSFVSKCKVWRLKESERCSRFQQGVGVRASERAVGGVETVWTGLKDCLLEVADEVCGRTKGRQRHSQTWWWNKEVDSLVSEKRYRFGVYNKSKNGVDKERYLCAKRDARRAVYKAKDTASKVFGEKLDSADGKGMVFRVAKQIVRKNRDVVGGGCVKNTVGKVVVEGEELMDVWSAHYDKLSNEEYAWKREDLSKVDAVCGPREKLSVEEVSAAIAKTKSNKSAGPSGVVADMLKAAGTEGVLWVTDLCNEIVKEGKIPEDWCKSWMVNVYKGKGDALECGSYRGIKLLDHVMKVLERVIEGRVRKIVKIDNMQFGFMAGKGTTDAIFIVRQLQEKYLAKKKDLWMAFVDLEKAFDRVPREVVWWALQSLGVDEWIVSVIKAMYEDATTVVKVNGRESKAFRVRVGVHQGSVLSPLLFVIVLEALSREFRDGLPLELLYADDLVLMAETEELLMEKLMKWKVGMESKGLRVNVGKTKVMRCHVRTGQREVSGKWPCGICKKGVGSNSIECTKCKAWIHKRCSGIKGKLQDTLAFRCRNCVGGGPVQELLLKEIGLGRSDKLECVDRFCYLGDMIGAGGGVEEASRARVRCAWGKFRELFPVVGSRGVSLRVKGKIYKACVQRVLVYGSETWAMKVEDMHRLERTERMMVRWMCGVTLKNKVSSAELNRWLDIESVADVVRRGRLRWFGHVERKNAEDWVSACRNFEVGGVRGRGRGRKTWEECVRNDMDELGLRSAWAQDRGTWRSLIWGSRPTHASVETRTLNR